MKKLFLIPLMAMLCTVMVWGTTRTAGTFQKLQEALEASVNGDVIELTADISWNDHSQSLLINKSISLDGKGKKITGYGDKQATLKIIGVENSQPTVAISNLTIDNKGGIAILIGGYLDSLCIENSTIESSASISGNPRAIEFVGPQTAAARIGIKNSVLKTTASGYPLRSYNPMILRLSNTKTSGYCALNFQPNFNTSGTVPPIEGYIGTRGTKVYAENCDFDAPNIHSGKDNGFACFALRDDGIDFHLTNCGMNAEILGNAQQQAFDLGGWWALKDRLTEVLSPESKHDINITIDGDNSHINGDLISSWLYVGVVPTTDGKYYFMSETGFTSNYTGTAPAAYMPESAFQYKANINFTIKGGTYAINPNNVRFHGHILLDQLTDEEKASDPDNYSDDKFESLAITIPEGYEVSEVKQGDVTLYRVVKKAEEKAPGVKYDLNDDVPTDEPGAGNNPVSSFDLSTGDEMTLNQEVTTAGYVQVKDHATEGATTVIVDKTAGGDEQRLIINNGLDVQGESSVEVKPGAAIIVGEGGINTQKPENIVIESTEEAQGVLLLDPTITVNQNPELTVKLKTHSKLNEKKSPTKWEYTYQRFAIPVMLATAGYVTNDFNPATNEYYDDEEAAVGFESYVWQWTGMQWETTTWNALERSIGYQLSNNSKNGDVTYTFTGNLIGNTNTLYEFDVKGFKFFGNSYTAPIMIEELLKGFKEIYPDVEASVWVYNYANKGWKSVNLDDIAEDLAYATTIKSMDGFILNLRSANSGVAGVDYTSAIWNNPDINPKATPAPARRSNASTVTNGVIINVVASEVGDDLTLVEREDRNSSFENGADASKVMNESGLNIYAETPAGTLSRVATDNLLGTQITFDAIDEEQYTLSFSNVRGSSYALRDNVTEKVIELVEGGTYEFTQAANSSITNRFEIVAVANAPTAIENVENNAKARGIYTVLGQYVGEASQWSTLPAGVYVVDGVKVVK